ncbi:recombinase family protein [Aquabacter cavernae]|uniref:recombinase family protein n=1 Tax=Aquabacter cavernae TaxID=2496029 RepID=UPI000F8C309B|nr:recombinase family protein [Aquabacter cavernae]
MAPNCLFSKGKGGMRSSESDGRPLAYSYIRMSTDHQLKGDSLRRQLQLSKAYADRHNLNLLETYQDIGFSAYTGENVSEGALGRFLAAIEAGGVPSGSYLLVESLDRISRQTVSKAFAVFSRIISLGMKVVTLQNEKTYFGDLDFLDMILSLSDMLRAHEESKVKSKRLSSAWDNKRTNAENRNMTPICPYWLVSNKDSAGFKIDEKKALVVRRVFEMSASGYGTGIIEKRLNGEGVPGIGKTGSWHKSYIQKILNNRAVIGEMQPHKIQGGKRVSVGNPIPNYFPKIVDDELFYRVQAARNQRKVVGAGRKGKFVSNLFSGLLICDYCGKGMRYIDKGPAPKGGKYLLCGTAERGLNCEKAYWKYELFERTFLSYVSEVNVSDILDSENRQNLRMQISKSMEALIGETEILKLKYKKLIELILNDDTDRRRSLLSNELKVIENQIDLNELKETDLRQKMNSLASDQSIDPYKLRELIERVQINGVDSYDLRIQIQHFLKTIIDSVQMFPLGNLPYFTDGLDELERLFSETANQNLISEISQMKDLIDNSVSSQPRFIVHFKNGDNRTIYMDSDGGEFPVGNVISKSNGEFIDDESV